jgi:hypothetical protein
VRIEGDWEAWLDFFLDAVANIADEAVASARELFLHRHPVVTVASVMKLLNTTKPTGGRAIDLLVTADVLVETTGKKRVRSSTSLAWFRQLVTKKYDSSTRRKLPGRPRKTDEIRKLVVNLARENRQHYFQRVRCRRFRNPSIKRNRRYSRLRLSTVLKGRHCYAKLRRRFLMCSPCMGCHSRYQ